MLTMKKINFSYIIKKKHGLQSPSPTGIKFSWQIVKIQLKSWTLISKLHLLHMIEFFNTGVSYRATLYNTSHGKCSDQVII